MACSVRAVELLGNLFSCRVAGRWVCGDVSADAQPVLLRRDALQRLLGSLESPEEIRSLDDEEIERCLSALGCELTPVDAGWQVIAPPSRRQDLSREVDLIEEVARLVGFDRFGSHLPDPIVPGRLTPIQQAERRLRRLFLVRSSGDHHAVARRSQEPKGGSRSRIRFWRKPVTAHQPVGRAPSSVRNLKHPRRAAGSSNSAIPSAVAPTP